jgi:hypothetical protein
VRRTNNIPNFVYRLFYEFWEPQTVEARKEIALPLILYIHMLLALTSALFSPRFACNLSTKKILSCLWDPVIHFQVHQSLPPRYNPEPTESRSNIHSLLVRYKNSPARPQGSLYKLPDMQGSALVWTTNECCRP